MKLIRYKYPQAPAARAHESFFRSAPAIGRFGSLFDDFFGGAAEVNQSPVDLYEDAQNYYARLELPGVKKAEIALELENGVLAIRSANVDESEEAKQAFSFQCALTIPEGVAVAKVSASHEDGILTITMPKEAARKPRRIEVK